MSYKDTLPKTHFSKNFRMAWAAIIRINSERSPVSIRNEVQAQLLTPTHPPSPLTTDQQEEALKSGEKLVMVPRAADRADPAIIQKIINDAHKGIK